MMDNIQKIVNLISVRNDKVLIVRKRDFWIFPGGKVICGESDYDCLFRELGEELPGVVLFGGIAYFDKFYGRSPSGGKIMIICYFGNIEGHIYPGAEISDACYVARYEFNTYPLSEITWQIIQKLLAEKFI